MNATEAASARMPDDLVPLALATLRQIAKNPKAKRNDRKQAARLLAAYSGKS